jgi:hypothetical protein
MCINYQIWILVPVVIVPAGSFCGAFKCNISRIYLDTHIYDVSIVLYTINIMDPRSNK